jgi:hypothetical protein
VLLGGGICIGTVCDSLGVMELLWRAGGDCDRPVRKQAWQTIAKLRAMAGATSSCEEGSAGAGGDLRRRVRTALLEISAEELTRHQDKHSVRGTYGYVDDFPADGEEGLETTMDCY